jgi:hypothetical protein
MRYDLIQHTRQPVIVAETLPHHWLTAIRMPGCATILDKLDIAVKQAVKLSPTGKITLIGHSIGGVLCRIYLSPQPFQGRCYNGLKLIDYLVTLGSPHQNYGGVRRGGPLSRWTEQHYPGAFFSPQVHYITVGGKWLRGSQFGTSLSRFVYNVYKDICGIGAVWGDGLIPVESALLAGAQHIVLDGVSHHAIFDKSWYGSPETIPEWWKVIGCDANL